jgi:streptogramin lyase
MALPVLIASCTQKPSIPEEASPGEQPERITRIALPGSGYIYDVAVSEGAVWVTSHAGLYRIDPATSEAMNVLSNDYLFRALPGHGALWISTGSFGRVLRMDPQTNQVTAEIDIRAGPVTNLAMSEHAVWASASSHLVRIDPVANEVVDRVHHERGFGDIAISDGWLWAIAGANRNGAVWRIDPVTAAVLQRIPLPNPSFWNEMEAGDGAIWVTSSPTVHRNGSALVRLHRIDSSTGEITAQIPLGRGVFGLGPEEGAASLATLAIGEGSVWALVDYESLVLRIDPADLSVSETLEGIATRSSDVGPGMTVGSGAVWVTSRESLTRISLQG